MEWINVKDRLPQKTGDYLILEDGKKCEVVMYSITDYMKPEWITGDFTRFGEVTHWMELPKLPSDGNFK